MSHSPAASPPPSHVRATPFCMPLSEALQRIDRTFGIDRILADEGRDIIAPYYIQSEPGYKRVHSQKGCMHVALNPDGKFSKDGYFTQIREVGAQIRATGATRVLELGSGMGFNTLALAADHPDVQFAGLDLMPHHVKSATRDAANLTNVRFVQGSYEDVPSDLYGADVIFGIETLCYASDLDKVARHVAAALTPGGRFVMYDPFRRPDFATAPTDVITAMRLFEVTTAVTNGFWRVEDWEAALTRAGLSILRSQDLTVQSIAGMRVLQQRAARFFGSWKYRVLRHFMPKYLIRNAVAGLIAPYVVEGADPEAGETATCVTYNLLIAEKPV